MMAVASGASFTSTSANTGNIVTAGTLQHGNSEDGAVLDVSGLKPGDSASGTVDITNTGDVAGVFTLSKANIVNSDPANPLSAKLDLARRGPRSPRGPGRPGRKYTGKLGAMGAIDLGTYAPGAAHRYRFTVSFPDGGIPSGPTTGDNAYKGDNVKVDYNWESVSN